MLTQSLSRAPGKSRVFKIAAAAAVIVGAGAAPALADPVTMPAITFPIDTASIVTAIVAAGAALLIAVFGPMIGFKFVRKLVGRLGRSV